ncbi:MAG: hypothetical protein ACHQ50_13730 [Fimbriimonadales bacterium]
MTIGGDAPTKVDSRRVYAIAREIVGPLAKDLGFKREKAMLSWTRPHGSQHLTFWFQVSQFGWNQYAGSQFTVEFQLSARPKVASGMQRARLPTLLTDADREEARLRENAVISRLVRPPRSYVEWIGSASADVASSYLRQFEPVDEPYYTGKDIWFRYASEDDVRRWCEFIVAKLPSAIDKFVAG